MKTAKVVVPFIAGGACITIGAARIYEPLGWIVCGILLLVTFAAQIMESK